ncbi:hypothetical protein BBJ28_00018829 [Nothophytophthora sp. Chile5]|nr:hypothetical protein BBJ28_00018829 [Nothophytophthora sp. Chile5]
MPLWASKTAPNAASPDGKQETTGVVALGLPPLGFYIAWLLLLGLHGACAFYLFLMTASYWVLTWKSKAPYAALWSDLKAADFKAFAVILGILGALHVLQVLHILFLSIRDRRLVLHCERSKACASKTAGVGSWCFPTAFVVREMVTVGALSYQTYQSSHLLHRVGLNSLTVAVLVAACWATPILQLLLRKCLALERVLSLVSSFVLCTFLAKVVPLLLFNSYADIFAMTDEAFGAKMVFDPAFVAVVALESRLMFASTVGDFIAKILPFICSFVTLVMLESLLSRRVEKVTPRESGTWVEPIQSPAEAVETAVETPNEQEAELSAAVDVETGVADGKSDEAKAEDRPRTPEKTVPANQSPAKSCSWPFLLLKLLFFVWGAVVLAFHLQARSRATATSTAPPLGCLSATRPWLGANTSCLSFVYDCHAQGTSSPTDAIFQTLKLDTEALGMLSFVHCPALIVPSALQWFPNLYSVHVFNSTLYAWGPASALVDQHHKRLVSVMLVYVKLAAFPEGLMAHLPETTINVEFFATSLPSVPSDLGTKWGVERTPIGRVGFEYGMLTNVSADIFQLRVMSLSLAGNYIYALPQLAQVPAATFLPSLILDANPLMLLPPASSVVIGDLSVESTKLTALPDWTKAQVKFPMHLHGSPFCGNATAAQQEASNANCSGRYGDVMPTSPLALFEATYPFA